MGFISAINPFDGDIVPGVNVGNAAKQAGSYVGLAPRADYDIFDGLTASNRPGQTQINLGMNNIPGSYLSAPATSQPTGNDNSDFDFAHSYQGDGRGAASAAPTSDPNQAAWYADQVAQLQAQIDRLGGQQDVGLQNIGNSYNQSYNRLTDQQAVNKRNYDTSVQQSNQGYANTRGGIMNQTNATANALQRLLGINGAGNSSAAFYAAPYAAGLQGSQAMNQAQQTYANNMSALDTNWQDAQRGYSDAFTDLDRQKFSQEQNLRSSIAQTRAGLLSKIAEANQQRQIALGSGYESARAAANPYLQQVNSLLDSIAALSSQFQNPVIKAGEVSYKAPDLGRYTLGQGGGIQQSQQPAASDMNPALLPILADRRDRDQFGQPLTY